MTRHLYVLENFRRAEIDQLYSKISEEYRRGMEARNATNRSILKSISVEATCCKEREKKIQRKYRAVMGKLGGDDVKNLRDAWQHLSGGSTMDQSWRESTQRAKLLEAQNLCKDAEDVVYKKWVVV